MPNGKSSPFALRVVERHRIEAIVAHLIFEVPLIQESVKLRTGIAQWGSEFVVTFGLLATFFGSLRWQAKAVPMMVGL